MTNLVTRKTKLIFTSADVMREQGKFREVVIEAHPLHATLRLKGLRTGYDIPWSSIWSMAVRADVEKKRAEKRKAKRGGR
jgi:hypothetical protein